MVLAPKHSAVIYIPNSFCVKLFFARPVDADVLQDIQNLSLNEGVEVRQHKQEQGQPWVVLFSPAYDSKDVGFEIEQLLHQHGINDLSIKIDEIGTSREIKTLGKSA